MTDDMEPLLTLYFPLWGASFDSDGVGVIGGSVMAYVPYADEWRTVQKTDVWKAQWSSEGGRVDGPTPPCCIVVGTPLEGAESLPAAIEAMGEALLAEARTAVTALRLFRAGWFLQPEQVLYAFSAPSLPLNIFRMPGPYRQVFNSGPSAIPLPGFELKLDDLTQRLDDPGPIAATWDLLLDYRDAGENASVEIAIESFNRSYGFQLRPPSRAANLFTALDAMLGSMSAWKIGRVPVKPRGYVRRVEVALGCEASRGFPGDPREEARWLYSANGGRGLRNAIAHGEGGEVESEARDAYERLQSIVRAVLRQYLHFSTIWARQHDETAARLSLAAESALAAAYVTTLEAEAKQPGSMLDLLQVAHVG